MSAILPIVLAVIREGDALCLLQRNRDPYRGFWGLPGGKMHFGETVAEAALREAREETGLDLVCERVGPTATEIIRTADGVPELHFIMVAAVLRAGSRAVTASEEGELAWYPLEGFLADALPVRIIPSDRIMARHAIGEVPAAPLHFHVCHEGETFRLVGQASPVAGAE